MTRRAAGGVGEYDALVVVSFGGPEGPADVMPFLRNVLAGRDVPESRVEEVAAQYRRFGGVSPLNTHNRSLVAAVTADLAARGLDVPVYWGNRNWEPYLADTVAAMASDGVRRAAAFVTSAYSSYSGCHQYLEDIAAARAKAGPGAPEIDKLRVFYDHPGFVEPLADALRAARAEAGDDAPVLFSAHSVPLAMAATSAYQAQLRVTAGLVARRSGPPVPPWRLVFQSRSGPPSVPWLEPDVRDALAELAGTAGPGDGGRRPDAVIVAPVGFTSDHMEVLYDLDVAAREAADALDLRLVRAGTPGLDPRFVAMVGDLFAERAVPGTPRKHLSGAPPWPDRCPEGCCPAPARRRPPAPTP